MRCPGPEIKALTARFQGRWRGFATLAPSVEDPAGAMVFGNWLVWPGLDGHHLLIDYTEERGGTVVYRGYGVHSWDNAQGGYVEYWFDNSGAVPRAPNRATLLGNVYRYLSETPRGTSRFTYVFDGDTLRFTIEIALPEGGWRTMHEGVYIRVGLSVPVDRVTPREVEDA